MAEVIATVASGVTIGSLATGIASSIVKLKLCWDQIQNAPEEMSDLIEELQILGSIIADIENDQQRNPISSLILDTTSISRCLQRCTEGADRLKDLSDDLSADLEASSRMRRKQASVKVVLKKAQLDRYKSQLERAIRLLTLSQQSYMRAQIQLQPDIILAKLTRNSTSGNIVCGPPDIIVPSATTSDTIVSTGTTTREIAPSYHQGWYTANLFGTIRYRTHQYSVIKGRQGRRKDKIEEFVAEYWSPSWLINRVWSIRAMRASSGWTFSPQTQTILPWESLQFSYAKQNNVKGLQELFSKKLASPFDCNEWGESLLILAAQYVSYNVCEFLVKEGANANQVDNHGLGPLDLLLRYGVRYLDAIGTSGLLLNDLEREVEWSPLAGTGEGFSRWQQVLEPFYYDQPIEKHFETAIDLLKYLFSGSNGPDIIRRAFAPDSFPSFTQATTASQCQTLMNAVASCIGDGFLWHPHVDCRELRREWLPFLIELVSSCSSISTIGYNNRTPLLALFVGYQHTDHIYRGGMARKVRSLLDLWLLSLMLGGIDLVAYGQKEVQLRDQGLVSWDYQIMCFYGDTGISNTCRSLTIKSITYGSEPSAWNVEFEYLEDGHNSLADEAIDSQCEEHPDSQRQMPGSWPCEES